MSPSVGSPAPSGHHGDGAASRQQQAAPVTLRLNIFPLDFSQEEVLLHRDDFPGLAAGDLVSVWQADQDDDSQPKLLLQVRRQSLYPQDHHQQQAASSSVTGKRLAVNRGIIYLEKRVADTFGLRNFRDVRVARTPRAEAGGLDSVELIFREQYLGRSEMWRIKSQLLGSAVHRDKKLSGLCGGAVRCQVKEMWAGGEALSCGVVTEETKVVFRSPTAMVYLFVQMSAEMWDFDEQGNLYYEKAVDGFLTDMFSRWQSSGSSHEVTIVLFARCFYDATSLSQFPVKMRSCLQTGAGGSIYEDFYRVVVQNERFEDWGPTLLELRQLFKAYRAHVENYHRLSAGVAGDGESLMTASSSSEMLTVPRARIAPAERGNFLEVLNMSLNTFENHFLNRNMERTGQQSIVLTPGVGIFEVDRDLTTITKQRIMDSGVGSDLICLGQQPLHAVPLLKFSTREPGKDDYTMPHWINLSFYSNPVDVNANTHGNRARARPEGDAEGRTGNRHQLGLFLEMGASGGAGFAPHSRGVGWIEKEGWEHARNTGRHYDFGVLPADAPAGAPGIPVPAAPAAAQSGRPGQPGRTRSQVFETIAESGIVPGRRRAPSTADASGDSRHQPAAAAAVDPDLLQFSTSSGGEAWNPNATLPSSASFAHHRALTTSSTDSQQQQQLVSGSLESPLDLLHQHYQSRQTRRGMLVVNPFDPASTTARVSSNRRRWTHIFPKFKSGSYAQPFQFGQPAADHKNPQHPLNRPLVGVTKHEWSAASAVAGLAASAGVDWRSLTTPALFPVTTDYFPGARVINSEYTLNEYLLRPDEINAPSSDSGPPGQRAAPNVAEVFNELVSQRLAQGFQLILMKEEEAATAADPPPSQGSTPSKALAGKGKKAAAAAAASPSPRVKKRSAHSRVLFDQGLRTDNTVWLSIGNIFHKVSLMGKDRSVQVVIYRPKEKSTPLHLQYRYRFQAPDNDTYEVSWVGFRTEQLEHYNWNVLDFYACTGGDREYELTDQLKYWRFRMYLIPQVAEFTACTKKIADGSLEGCDVYHLDEAGSAARNDALVAGFHRFVDSCLNKLRRRATLSAAPSSASLDRQTQKEPPPLGRPLLSRTSSPQEVCQRMADPSSGFNFFAKHDGFPERAFLSCDAVGWAVRNVEGVGSPADGFAFFRDLVATGAVCHASGSRGVPFRYGYFIYGINAAGPGAKTKGFPYAGDLDAFSNDWIEVELDLEGSDGGIGGPPSSSSTFASARTDSSLSDRPTDRPEWAHLYYQRSRRHPASTFEMGLHWSVATGACLGELAHSWTRKGLQCGFSLIPIPHDPFALPITANSDPVRGPIFVEMVRLPRPGGGGRGGGWEDEEKRWDFRFRDALARRFGFVPCTSNARLRPSGGAGASWSTENQYVHYTGNMFLLIPTEIRLQTGIQGVKEDDDGPAAAAEDEKPDQVITRSLSDKKPVYDHSKTGFLWSWNFMVSRKWKQLSNTGATGDIPFMDKFLLDFRKFCSNKDGRLERFMGEFSAADGGS